MADATLKLSGYLASAAAATFSGHVQGLDNDGSGAAALTDNEYTSLTVEVDNTNTKYAYADWDLVLASAAFTGADSGMEIYLVPCVDGTNYPTWTADGTTDEPENSPYYVAFAPTTGTTAAQRITGARIPLPNGKFKWGFRSRANVTLATTGNTFSWRPHGFLADEA